MTEYYLYYRQPVFVKKEADGDTVVHKLNRQTGLFEQVSNRLVIDLLTDHDNVRTLSEAQFIQEVEKLRSRSLKGEGTVYDLYAVINAMEELAQTEKRWLTMEEGKIIKKLREKTYLLFEQEHRSEKEHLS